MQYIKKNSMLYLKAYSGEDTQEYTKSSLCSVASVICCPQESKTLRGTQIFYARVTKLMHVLDKTKLHNFFWNEVRLIIHECCVVEKNILFFLMLASLRYSCQCLYASGAVSNCGVLPHTEKHVKMAPRSEIFI